MQPSTTLQEPMPTPRAGNGKPTRIVPLPGKSAPSLDTKPAQAAVLDRAVAPDQAVASDQAVAPAQAVASTSSGGGATLDDLALQSRDLPRQEGTSQRRVLIAGDAPVFMNLIRDELKRYIIEGQVVEEGHQVLERVGSLQPDLIILVALCGDRAVPSGLSLCTALKDDPVAATAPLLIVLPAAEAASGDEEHRQLVDRSDAHLTLPLQPGNLVRAIAPLVGLAAEDSRWEEATRTPTRVICTKSISDPEQDAAPAASDQQGEPPLISEPMASIPTGESVDLAPEPAFPAAGESIPVAAQPRSRGAKTVTGPLRPVPPWHRLCRRLSGLPRSKKDQLDTVKKALAASAQELAELRQQARQPDRAAPAPDQSLVRCQWDLMSAKKQISDLARELAAMKSVPAAVDRRQLSFRFVVEPVVRRTRRPSWMAGVTHELQPAAKAASLVGQSGRDGGEEPEAGSDESTRP